MNFQEGATSSEIETEFRTEEASSVSPILLKAIITECLNSWVNYLQVLNSFCSAGFRLSQCLGTLAQTYTIPLASQCQASWEELGKATIIASNTVKTHIAAAMQDMIIIDTESDAQKQQEHNQQIIYDNLLTFINLQYQFSIAGCECFGQIATCPCCQTNSGGHDPDCSMSTIQQCFSKFYNHDTPVSSLSTTFEDPNLRQPSPPLNRETSPVQAHMHRNVHLESIRGPFPAPGLLYTMKTPFRNTRSPLQFPLFPLSGQRRWSEVATADKSESSDQMRRWSMPWDCARVETGAKYPMHTSKLSIPSHQDRSSAGTLQSRATTPGAEIPNPTIISSEGLADAIQLLSTRPKAHAGMSQGHEGTHSEMQSHKRLQHIQHRQSWQSSDNNTSRKSSSSTDSSSCLSIHSRSASDRSDRGSDGGGESVRSHHHMYSIWSGSDHLPFIRLPESQEPQEDSDNESNNSNHLMFPRPI